METDMDYKTVAHLVERAEAEASAISAVVLREQAEAMEQTESALIAAMRKNLCVMREAVEAGNVENSRSGSGLTGGDAYRMENFAKTGGLTGGFFERALAKALAVSEYNACMGKIVASPTAGSCGILPAAILTLAEERELPEDACVMALFTAGAFGMVIAQNASISGAEGGCQAECGSAAAMAAAALVELAGGTPQMCADACAIALKNQLGLVCDPVAGLVEVPCIKRNAGGIACALAAADMALAGIKSVIPADEVIGAVREVGKTMPACLRETGEGGLAATPTAARLKKELFGDGR